MGPNVACRAGEAQRLSSLTFGCFQVRGKNPQVLTGPKPFHRIPSSQQGAQSWEQSGENLFLSASFWDHWLCLKHGLQRPTWCVCVYIIYLRTLAVLYLLLVDLISCCLPYSLVVNRGLQSISACDAGGKQQPRSPRLSLRLHYASWPGAKK